MQLFSLVILALVAQGVVAFAPARSLRFAASTRSAPLFDGKSNLPVPMEKGNIESAASVTGGILGFILAGPVAGVVLAAIANYVSKKDNEGGEALRGVGKSVIDAYNYISKLNEKFDISGKVTTSVSEAVDKAAEESEAVGKFKGIVTKVGEINAEFGLVEKGKDAIVAAATLSDAALEKVEELNDKYDFVKITKEVILPHTHTHTLY